MHEKVILLLLHKIFRKKVLTLHFIVYLPF